MPYETIPETESITLIDTEMFGETGFTAAYLFESDKTLLVDAGLYENGPDIERTLMDIGAPPEELDYLAISHLHLDHAGGATYLADRFPDAEVLCHSITAEYLTDETKLRRLFASGQEVMAAFSEAYGEADPLDRDRLTCVDDGDGIDLGGRRVRVLHAPGHAPHQICFFDEGNEALHLVDEGCALIDGDPYPTTPPPDFDLERTLDSLDRFAALEPSHLLYSHFGYRRGGRDELNRHREILEDWVEMIRAYRQQGRDEEEIVTDLLDQFGGTVPGNFREILKRDARGVLHYLRTEDGNN